MRQARALRPGRAATDLERIDVRRPTPGLRQNTQNRATDYFSISKPFDPTGVFPALPFPQPYKYPCIHPELTVPPSPPLSVHHPSITRLTLPFPPLKSILSQLSATCQRSSATQRVSGSSTSTGPCTPSVASGTRKEGVLIYGNAFVPVRPRLSADRHIPLIRCHTDHSTPGTQVSHLAVALYCAFTDHLFFR